MCSFVVGTSSPCLHTYLGTVAALIRLKHLQAHACMSGLLRATDKFPTRQAKLSLYRGAPSHTYSITVTLQ
jgi:hypothetical protein